MSLFIFYIDLTAIFKMRPLNNGRKLEATLFFLKLVNHERQLCIFRTLAYSEQFIQSISRIFMYIQRYWCIFSHTHRYREGRSQSILILERKALIVSIFEYNFSMFLSKCSFKIIRRKISKIYPCRAFFFVLLKKCLSNCPSSTSPPDPPFPPLPTVLFLQNYSPKYNSVLITAG